VNAAGHVTVFGGSCPSPEVVKAMDLAAERWVDMRLLEQSAGRFLSKHLGCEDGIVTSGAYTANAMAAHTALALAAEKGRRPAQPNIVIQTPHITKYAESYVTGGIRLKEIARKSQAESLNDHIDKDTVAVAYVVNDEGQEFSLKDTVEVCARAALPALVDAAVVDPVVRGVKEVLAYGPDAVSVSGGKGFNGPNSSGLLVGKSGFISRARTLSFPNYGPGRAMKVSKEQIVGLMMAVSLAASANPERLVEGWKKKIEAAKKDLAGIPNVRTETLFPWRLNFPQPIPRLGVHIETPDGEVLATEVKKRLANGEPPILVRPSNDVVKAGNCIVLDLRTVTDKEVRVTTESLRTALLAVVR
jgi:L-seryl-tRNA(Ser) seleniumtransferase